MIIALYQYPLMRFVRELPLLSAKDQRDGRAKHFSFLGERFSTSIAPPPFSLSLSLGD